MNQEVFTFLQEFLNNSGFPIFACCVMFYQQDKLTKTLTEVTKTLSSLTDKIENLEKEVRDINE